MACANCGVATCRNLCIDCSTKYDNMARELGSRASDYLGFSQYSITQYGQLDKAMSRIQQKRDYDLFYDNNSLYPLKKY